MTLLFNIWERKSEGRNPFYRVVDLTDETEDPAVWGKNFPLQYDGYTRTVDRGSGELHGFPRAGGGRPHPWRVHRLLAHWTKVHYTAFRPYPRVECEHGG